MKPVYPTLLLRMARAARHYGNRRRDLLATTALWARWYAWVDRRPAARSA